MKPLLVYLLLINALELLLMLTDKFNAKNKLRRIPEAALVSIAILGGSIGGMTGMYMARHKTRHPKFSVGFPIMAIVQTLLLVYISVTEQI